MNRGRRIARTGLGLSLGAVFGLGASAQAATYEVDKEGPDPNSPCTSGNPDDCTLAGAVALSNASTTVDDVITFESTLTGHLVVGGVITDGVSIQGNGAFGDDVLTLRAFPVFHVQTGEPVSISGLRIYGSIYATNSDLTVTDMLITNGYPHGMGITGGVVTIDHTTIEKGDTGGASDIGGGIVAGDADISIVDSTIADNTALGSGGGFSDGGGGIATFSGSLSLLRSTVTGNRVAEGNGGGILSSSTDLSITDSTISENTVYGRLIPGAYLYELGGGLFWYANFDQPTPTITDSTFSGNYAAGSGGAIADYNGQFTENSATIQDSTISGNTALNAGGIFHRLDLQQPTLSQPPMELRNTIVAGNDVSGGSGALDVDGEFSGAFDLFGDTGGLFTFDEAPGGSSIMNVDPQLGPLADNGGPTETMLPAPTSPAIDQGLSAATSDQRGLARPFDVPTIDNSTSTGANGADIGAVELNESDLETPEPPQPPSQPPGSGGGPPGTGPTGQRAKALKKCKRKHSRKARKRCRKRAKRLPL